MTSAGLLVVSAERVGDRLENLAVSLQRPPVTQLFVGQIPEAVVKTIPYLYTLCAHAQRAAAQAALAAAMGEPRRSVDDVELWVELLHEIFWRLLLDWPTALGLPPAQAAFAAWRTARQGDQCLAETQKLIAVSVRPMAAACLMRLDAMQSPGSTPDESSPAHVLPELAPLAWLAYWQGLIPQPPALVRPASSQAAFRKRLAEVEYAAEALASATPYPVIAAGGDGWGVAQTITARGILTHAVHVEDGRVVRYRVVAPTDIHFADASALAGLLAGQQVASVETGRQLLEQAVLALDPCLPYTLELNDA